MRRPAGWVNKYVPQELPAAGCGAEADPGTNSARVVVWIGAAGDSARSGVEDSACAADRTGGQVAGIQLVWQEEEEGGRKYKGFGLGQRLGKREEPPGCPVLLSAARQTPARRLQSVSENCKNVPKIRFSNINPRHVSLSYTL